MGNIKNPDIKTKVVHSETKSAWNIVGVTLGQKYKIARIPYITTGNEKTTSENRAEALKHAKFISYCFNNSGVILNTLPSFEISPYSTKISKIKQ